MAIITILQFPESESCKILVNLESLQGIKDLLLETNLLIQLVRANKLLLILPLSEFAFDIVEIFSLPAKSTKINLPKIT